LNVAPIPKSASALDQSTQVEYGGGHGRGRNLTGVRVTHIGGPTALLEIGGWRLLTDPTFDPAGGSYRFGWGTGSEKLAAPAIAAADIGPIDAVLLSHDQHDDNLDRAGRELLPSAGAVLTTVPGARRLGGNARGLAAWDSTRLDAEDRPAIEVTATPCRHGPPLSHPIVGEVVGFSLSWEGQEGGVVWISGDTVLYDGVREVADRLDVDIALVHLGGVRFPISGPARYTMTAAQAVELCGLLRPRVTIPIHYEGWKHFRQGRDEVEAELAAAPPEVRDSVRWLPLGEAVEIG
jgi:L-ascorbate metabolism protein UlaG (beta-lactamase superfamily)